MNKDSGNNISKKSLIDDSLTGAESLLDSEPRVEKRAAPENRKTCDSELTVENVETEVDVLASLKKCADLRIYKSGDMIAVRIGMKNYTSNDANLPDEIRTIMKRAANGESAAMIIKDYRGTVGRRGGGKGFGGFFSSMPGLLAEFFRNMYHVIIAILAIVLLIQVVSIMKGCG